MDYKMDLILTALAVAGVAYLIVSLAAVVADSAVGLWINRKGKG